MQGPIIQQPRAPAPAAVISAPAPPASSSYSSPSEPASSAPSSSSSYSAPSSSSYSSPAVSSAPASVGSNQPLEILTQYGAGATNTWSQGSPLIQDTVSALNNPAPAPAAPAVTYGNSADQISEAVSAYSSSSDSNSFNTVDFDSITDAGGQSFEPASYSVNSDSSLPASPSVQDNSAPASDSYGEPQFPPVAPTPSSAPDSYGEPVYPTLPPQPAVIAAAPPADEYGEPRAAPLPPQPVSITTARSFTVDYDDYDPNDVPADQAKVKVSQLFL